MSTSAFTAISSLTLDSTQLQNTGTAQNPNLSFATNPQIRGNLIVESGNMLELHNPADTFLTSIKAGAQLVNIGLTLPLTVPSIGQALISLDGAPGNLGWGNVATSVGATIAGGVAFFTDTSGTLLDCNTSAFFTWDNNSNNFAAGSYPTFVNSGSCAIISGSSNLIDTGVDDFILGGSSNQIQNAQNSGIIGGLANLVTANYSFCFGGTANTASGANSYAFGFKSVAAHDYSFVFSDHNNLSTGLQTTASGQFLIQSVGGFGFVGGNVNLSSFPNNFINIYSDLIDFRAKLQYKNNGGITSTTLLNALQVKGDLEVFNGNTNINDRLPVGVDNTVLVANSLTDLGVEWASSLQGLASIEAGNVTLAFNTVVADNLVIASGHNTSIRLYPDSTGTVNINNGIDEVPLRFFNASGNYVGLKPNATISSNLTFTLPNADTSGVMVSNGSGTLSLTATPSGLTSVGIGNITITTTGISAAQGFGLSISGTGAGILNINNGNDIGRIRLYNAIGNHYSGLMSGASSTNTEWSLPSSDVAGVMVSNGSGALSLTATPSGLTSITAGDITIIGDKITGTNGVLVESTGSGQSIGLSPKGASQVRVFSQDASNAIPIVWYNSANTHFVGLKAGTLSADTTWVLPTADTVGTLVSDGSANLSLTQSPSIFRSIVTVSGTSKTFALSDANTFQQCTNGSTVTLTVDTNANVAFTVGTEIDILQEGAGQVVIAAAGGVTIESVFSNLKIANQYTGATLKKLATNTWVLTGNLTA